MGFGGMRGNEFFLIIIIGVVLFIIFGPKNLPKLGQSVGKTMRSFKEGMEGSFDEEEKKSDAQAGQASADANAQQATAQPSEPATPAETPAQGENQ